MVTQLWLLVTNVVSKLTFSQINSRPKRLTIIIITNLDCILCSKVVASEYCNARNWRTYALQLLIGIVQPSLIINGLLMGSYFHNMPTMLTAPSTNGGREHRDTDITPLGQNPLPL